MTELISETMPQTADLIFQNAVVITCSPDLPEADSLAIKGDRILLTGSHQETRQLRDKHTRIIDCSGRTLVPGFHDAHCHFFSTVRRLLSLDLSPAAVGSIAEIQSSVKRRTRELPPGEWIRGTGYNEFYLREKRHPTRKDLDEAAPHHPVVLLHRSLHACVLNSLALKLAGIDSGTEEPPGGMIDRDLETGEPSGILYDMQEFLRDRIPLSGSPSELEWGITETGREFLSLGITSIGDATVTNGLEQWESFRALALSGKLPGRISMMVGHRFLQDFRQAGLTTGSGDDRLRVGSLKIVLTETTGQLHPHRSELNHLAMEAARAGFQVAVHAVERNTVEAAISALEYIRDNLPGGRIRHRIEHCSECPPELVQRLKKLPAVVVSQPPFIYYSGERYLALVGPEALQWLYPFRSLIESGIRLAGSSDSPVVPPNPLIGIYAAVTRLAESGQPVLPAEAVSPAQALNMYTSHAAYASGAENDTGSLSPGKLADIVMLSHNPLAVPPEQIKDIRVEMTVLGGEIAYRADA